MLRALPAAIAASLVCAPASADPDRPVVAVFALDGKDTKLAPKTLTNLSEYFAAALGSTGRYQLIPTSELKERLQQAKADSFKSCYDQACQIEVGKELAAEKSLSTRVMRIGARCVVTANLYDLKRATTDRSATREGACTEEAVMGSLKGVVEDLGPTPVAARPEPPTRPAPPRLEDPNQLDYWRQVDKGDYEQRDGSIIGSTGLLVSKSVFGDVTADLDVELLGGTDAGWFSLGWRAGGEEASKPTRAYSAGFQWSGTYHVFVAVADQWRTLVPGWTQNWPWKPTNLVHKQRNHLRVEAFGPEYKVFINGQLLASGSDPTHASGKFYLACGAGAMCKLSNIQLAPRP